MYVQDNQNTTSIFVFLLTHHLCIFIFTITIAILLPVFELTIFLPCTVCILITTNCLHNHSNTHFPIVYRYTSYINQLSADYEMRHQKWWCE